MAKTSTAQGLRVRKELTKSHVVSWILIMAGEDAMRAVTLLEKLVPEGTYVRIFIKESQEPWRAFIPSIDKNGVTRFKTEGDDFESPALLRTPYDRRWPQNYSLKGRQLTIAVKEMMLALVLGKTFPDGSVDLKAGGETTFIEVLSSVMNFS
ncbi:uncharacterized protein [Macrobrachium rosenbergii]|uniref:uncharacterized protein n=1 Tax=Macrobrachium rosenbergii TaxID=79674 RepID=UPI0034D5E1AC